MNAPSNPNGIAPRRSQGLWVVLLLAVFAWAPATYPGYWQSTEGFAPIFNARYPAPIAEIATAADLWRGTGSAAFLLTRPLLLLGLSPTAAVRVVFVLVIVAGGLGIYSWLRPRYGDRAASLAGAVYALMPPLLTTVYVRGDLADALVLGMLPLVLAGLAAYRLSRSPAFMGLSVVALLWIWRTQAGLAIFVTLLLLIYAAIVERDRLAVLALAIAGAAGLLSLIPLWAVTAPAPDPFAEHFLSIYQLLSPLPAGDEPLNVGFVPLAFGLVAAWLLWMRRRGQESEPDRLTPLLLLAEQRRLIVFGLVAWGVVSLLSLRISQPLWQLAGADRLLSYPWQILLPALPFLAATAGSLPLLAPQLARRGLWASLLALVVLGALPFLSPAFVQYTPPAQPVASFGTGVDLVLLEADVTSSSTGDGGTAALSVTWQPLRSFDFDYNVFFQALEAEPAGEGYRVVAQLDQQPLPERPATTWQPGEVLTATYRLDLPVDPNQANLRYYFGYYDWRDGRRLPLSGGVDDKVILYDE